MVGLSTKGHCVKYGADQSKRDPSVGHVGNLGRTSEACRWCYFPAPRFRIGAARPELTRQHRGSVPPEATYSSTN